MALLTGWTGKDGYSGPDNKVMEEGVKSITIPTGLITIGTVVYQTSRNVTTQRYSYVGMSYATALDCQTAMIAACSEGGVLYADVSVTRQAGAMWQCTVSYCKDIGTITVVSP